MDRGLRPMLPKYGPCEGVDFAEGDGSDADALAGESESADAGEKVERIHFSASGGCALRAAK